LRPMHPYETDIPSDEKAPSPPKEENWAEENQEHDESNWDSESLLSPGSASPTWIDEDEEDEGDNPLDWDLLVTVGWLQRSAFPEWGVGDVRTHCATHHETSFLHGEVRQHAEGRIALSLGQSELDLPLVSGTDDLVVELEILLAGVRFRTLLTVIATSGPPLMVLGRDALAGRFLVDPSRSWVDS